MIRIGIIGVGKMGLSHLAVANSLKNIEIAAVADSSFFITKALKKYGQFKTYLNYKEMLENEKLDGAIISLPNKLHYAACMDCIERDVSFFIEKPFTLDPEQSKEIVERARSKGILGMVGYVNKFAAIFEKIKEIIDEGILGNIYDYKSIMLGNVVGPETKNSWRNNVSEGGGCLYDYGSHAIDLAIFYFGELHDVIGSELIKVYSEECEDVVYAMLKHKNGIIGNIYVNWCDTTQRKAYNQIEICGTNGKLIANKQEMRVFVVKSDEKNSFNFKSGWNMRYVTDYSKNVPFYLRGEEFTKEIMEFIAMMEAKEKTIRSTIESALLTDIAIKKIREKAQTK
jgi:predicted dehydrogenase